METAKAAETIPEGTLYGYDGEEKHDTFPLAVICYIILGVIAIAVLAITAGLYFDLHHLNLGQYYHSLRWLEFIIPAIFLIACCLILYFYVWQNPTAKEPKKNRQRQRGLRERTLKQKGG